MLTLLFFFFTSPHLVFPGGAQSWLQTQKPYQRTRKDATGSDTHTQEESEQTVECVCVAATAAASVSEL